jgi:mRNA-degrading endonuclease RelE of RelBE toxin-antitoxin system
MKYKVVISEKAIIELNKSIDWYNEQKAGLGRRFYSYVNKAINTIAKNPFAFELKFEDFRCFPINVFPFVVVYFIEEPNKIIITAIFHTSRNPEDL